jgi:ubiquinone/menaquinone biosynthesis C-methylase UbiE
MPPKTHIEGFYDDSTQREWERLDRHRTELALTLKALNEHLPPSPADVLDIGGGPGRYAIELSRRGYAVTLLDLSLANLELAAVKAAEAKVSLHAALHANALDLRAFDDGSFDAVLLMGPLYHLIALEDRIRCIQEAKRVLKPGGVLFAAFINRYGVFVDAAAKYPNDVFERRALWEGIWQDGVNPPPHDSFTDAYFALPAEILPLMEGQGFTTLNLLGLEGIVSGHEEAVNALEGEAWEYWVRLNYDYAHDPALQAFSQHLLYVGKKP